MHLAHDRHRQRADQQHSSHDRGARLAAPEEIRERGKKDTRYLLPDAQFRYERTLEPPTVDEGFETVEAREFVRALRAHAERTLTAVLTPEALDHQGPWLGAALLALDDVGAIPWPDAPGPR